VKTLGDSHIYLAGFHYMKETTVHVGLSAWGKRSCSADKWHSIEVIIGFVESRDCPVLSLMSM
jgi:hypothetical protein